MISSKSFISLLGAEYEMLRLAGGKTLTRFYVASCSITCICVISFLSIIYAVRLLFHNLVVEIILSLFVSGLFFVFYVFLLNTFAKRKDQQVHLTLSNISRTTFVIFMAFIISKPVEIYFLEERLNEKIEDHRENVVAQFSNKVTTIYSQDIDQLRQRQQQLIRLSTPESTDIYSTDLALLDQRINELVTKTASTIDLAKRRVEKSDFFVRRLILSSQELSAWLIFFGILFLFLLPGFLIYSLSADNKYFQLKKQNEEELIVGAYTDFLHYYKTIFRDRYKVQLVYYCPFLDPPFKEKPIPPPEYKKDLDFFRKYILSKY